MILPSHKRGVKVEKKEPRIEDIKRLYFGKKLPIDQVAKRLGFSYTTIRSKMRETGIELRSLSESQKLRFARKRVEIPLDEVLRLYFDEKEGLDTIAKKYRCAYTYIKTLIEGAGYQIRNKSEAGLISHRKRRILFTSEEQDEIVQLYTVEKVSIADLADKFHVSNPVVSRFLQSKNITLRSSAEQRKIQGRRQRKPPELTAPETVEKLEPEEVNKKKVHELRYVENKSLAEIAAMAGMSTIEIYSILGGK